MKTMPIITTFDTDGNAISISKHDKNIIEKVPSWYNKESISDLDKFLLEVENRFFIVKCDDKKCILPLYA